MGNGAPAGDDSRRQGWQRGVKRALDAALAGGALTALSPLMLACSALVWGTMGRPVLYRQQRPGQRGRLIMTYKFRTMCQATDAEGRDLPDSQRLTTVGRLMRRASLDELPQLWNVVRGDMSLVGPRPLLVQYLPRYSQQQIRRHDVPPGITGWAQVTGRNATTWDERFALDRWYVDNWSLGLDLKIMLMTVATVIRGSGISHPGHQTMPEFMGNED